MTKRRKVIEANANAASATVVAALIRAGDFVPVMVFGTDDCCEHGRGGATCDSTGFGLCDRFTTLNAAGSDCNRSEFFLVRPSDALMGDPKVRAALEDVLTESGEPTARKSWDRDLSELDWWRHLRTKLTPDSDVPRVNSALLGHRWTLTKVPHDA